MDGGPVYFIGGTYGGGSSGWVIAIITATLTTFGAFIIGLLHEDYRRHRDRKALANVFWSDIRVRLQLWEELRLEASYRELREALAAGRDALPTLPYDGSTSLPIVFEKCADRVGALGQREADGVIRFYDFVASLEVGLRLALGSSPTENRRPAR